jgi:hypothetical protein
MAEQSLNDIVDLPAPLREFASRRAEDPTIPATLESMLPGNSWESTRQQLRNDGMSVIRSESGGESILAAEFNPDGTVMNIAAAVPRNPGKSYDYLKEIEDFKSTTTTDRGTRVEAIALFHKLVRNEGIAANAINKLAALVACDGSFKVQSVRGQKGRAANTVAKDYEEAMNWWKDNLNASSETGVITGDRGITCFFAQGTRLALIEGDHVARHVWPSQPVQLPNGKSWKLPMNIQSYSTQHIEIPRGLEGTNFEIMYWKPPTSFLNTLRQTTDLALKKILDKAIPSKVRTALLKDGKYLLDPELLIHIKHRGTGIDNFGMSLLEPAMSDFRYKRALDALEITTITNLINRVVILKVGSDDPNSAYHRQEVTAARLTLLQRIMRQAGPSATILWGGPDLSVEQVSAHESILSLDERYKIAERRILMALGVPSVLMIGEGGDGKAVGYAAALAVAAQLRELQNQYRAAMIKLAHKVALENNIKDVVVTFEWHENLLDNKEAAAEMILKLFQLGLLGSKTALEELGFDHSAEVSRQQEEVSEGYKDRVFGPPPAALTTNPTGVGGGNGGRPTREEDPSRDPRSDRETLQSEE